MRNSFPSGGLASVGLDSRREYNLPAAPVRESGQEQTTVKKKKEWELQWGVVGCPLLVPQYHTGCKFTLCSDNASHSICGFFHRLG